MYGCESCNNLYRRLSTLELMLSNCSAGEDLKSPWTARRSNQWILKEINPEYLLEGLMLKLKLQYFSHMMQRVDSLGKTLMPGKTEGKRRRAWQRMRWLDSITDSMTMNLSKLQETEEVRGARHALLLWVTKSQTQLSNWTTTTVSSTWRFKLRIQPLATGKPELSGIYRKCTVENACISTVLSMGMWATTHQVWKSGALADICDTGNKRRNPSQRPTGRF